MRGGRGTLGICLANEKWSQGGALDKLSRGLKKRSQKGSSSPSNVPSWTDQPTADTYGKSQATVVASMEMKHDQSKVGLILHSGSEVLQYLKESVGRNSAPGASISKAVVLFSAPSEEHLAGVSFGIGDRLGSDLPGRGSKATDSRGQYHKGESWVSGWPGHPKLREMAFLNGAPLNAAPQSLGTGPELSYPYSELCQLPYAYAHYEALPEDQMRRMSLSCLSPVFSEQTESENTLSSTSDGLQMLVGSLALQSFRLSSL